MKTALSQTRHPSIFPCLLLIGMALLAFGGVLRNGFVYDDLLIIYGNPFFTTRQHLIDLFSSNYFALSRQGSYRPMVTLSYLIDGTLWGMRPFGFHLTNLLLHLANLLLLFRLAKKLDASEMAAFFGTALFAVHPVFTEAVAFPNYREDLLVLLFSLVSLECLWGRPPEEAPSDKQSTHHVSRITPYVAVLFYFFALLSKESGLGLLIFLVIATWMTKSPPPSPGQQNPAKGPLVPWSPGPLVLYLLVTVLYLILRFGLYGASNELKASYISDSFFTNLLTMCGVMLSYLWILVAPFCLRPDYRVEPLPITEGLLALAGVLLLLALAWKLVCRRGQNRPAVLACGWFFAFLLPVMNLYPIAHPQAERYLYLPCVGLFLLVGAGIAQIREKLSRPSRPWFAGAFALVLLGLIATARAQVAHYRNNLTLWERAVHCEPNSPGAHNNLGMEYLERGDARRALHQFDQAWSLGQSPRLSLNLAKARALLSPGGTSLDTSIEQFRKTIKSLPEGSKDLAFLHHELAILLRKAGHYEEALREHRNAESLNPLQDEFYLHHGITLQKAGQLPAAITNYQKALRLFPDRAQTYYNLGSAKEALEQWKEARAAYETALRLEPGYPEAHAGLGTILLRQQSVGASLEHFRFALDARPGQATWRFNYLQALLLAGKTSEAKEQLKRLQAQENLPQSISKAVQTLDFRP